MDNLAQIFETIYRTNAWGDGSTRSGQGSNDRETSPIRAWFPKLVERYQIKSVYDAGCGECTWFPQITFKGPLAYTGAEIVPAVVQANRERYPHLAFVSADVTETAPPPSDLIICRDVFVHLPIACIRQALARFKASGSAYLLATTMPGTGCSETVLAPGAWRILDMATFAGQPVELHPDSIQWPYKMCGLWHISSIKLN